MTTLVTVKACCTSDMEAVVEVWEQKGPDGSFVVIEAHRLRDGQERTEHVYPGRRVEVYEHAIGPTPKE